MHRQSYGRTRLMPDNQVLQHQFLKTVPCRAWLFLKTSLLPSSLPSFSLLEGKILSKSSSLWFFPPHISGSDIGTRGPNMLLQVQEQGTGRATQSQHFLVEFPGWSNWWPWQTCAALEKLLRAGWDGASEPGLLQLLRLMTHAASV